MKYGRVVSFKEKNQLVLASVVSVGSNHVLAKTSPEGEPVMLFLGEAHKVRDPKLEHYVAEHTGVAAPHLPSEDYQELGYGENDKESDEESEEESESEEEEE